MAPGFSILLQPLRHATFHVQGEFGPAERGPRAYASSLPLPLPSTLLGALADALIQTGAPIPGDCDDLEYCIASWKIVSDTLGSLRLRGPALYIEGERGYAVCVPYGRDKLSCTALSHGNNGVRASPCTELIEPKAATQVRIALNNLSKTAMESMIYTIDAIDLGATAYTAAKKLDIGQPHTKGILLEAYPTNPQETSQLLTNARKLLDGRIVALGTKSAAAHIAVLDKTPIRDLIEAAAKANHQLYIYITSPIILNVKKHSIHDALVFIASLAAYCKNPISSKELQKEAVKRKLAPARPQFTAIGLGYSLKKQRRRVYKPALLPGAAVKLLGNCQPQELIKKYIEGFGEYRDAIWGTTIPLPPPCGTIEAGQ